MTKPGRGRQPSSWFRLPLASCNRCWHVQPRRLA
uniref:Uncharacterized protein n=1 Tax=Aromatoleum anaerobium TaxID=182180 RepID=A0ABX1PTX0_9RHOO